MSLQQQVAFIGKHDQPLTPPEQSFTRLMQRIKADDRQRLHTNRLSSGQIVGIIKSAWQRWSVRPPVWVVSLLLLVAVTGSVSVFLYRDVPQPLAYRTLAETPAVNESEAPVRILRAVFDGSLSLDNFHKLLRECGVTIDAGPNSAGAYTLQVLADDGRQNALACMRTKSVVRFAEPVTGGHAGD
jgi:hypothetical protein